MSNPENHSATTNGATSTVDTDRQRIDQLQREVEQLRRELAQARAERDDYLGLLRKVAPAYAITAADVQEALNKGVTLGQLLEEAGASRK